MANPNINELTERTEQKGNTGHRRQLGTGGEGEFKYTKRGAGMIRHRWDTSGRLGLVEGGEGRREDRGGRTIQDKWTHNRKILQPLQHRQMRVAQATRLRSKTREGGGGPTFRGTWHVLSMTWAEGATVDWFWQIQEVYLKKNKISFYHFRIDFKILLLTYKVLNGLSPSFHHSSIYS